MHISAWWARILLYLGQGIDHFDTGLYGFLAPLMAPLFFPHHDPLIQLILTYGVLGVGIIGRPLGALILGRWADHRGPWPVLAFTILGISLAMGGIALCPTHQEIGIGAPILLVLFRLFLDFCAAGERTITALVILDDCATPQAVQRSSFYQSMGFLGLILASSAASLVIASEGQISWRWAFAMGGAVGTALWIARLLFLYKNSLLQAMGPPAVFSPPQTFRGFVKHLGRHRPMLWRISLISAFSYGTYAFPFVLMNTFPPMLGLSPLTHTSAWTPLLMVGDLILTPCVGWLISAYDPGRVMRWAALMVGFSTLPAFALLPYGGEIYILSVRIWIVLWGVIFACPMMYWIRQNLPVQERYNLSAIGHTLGSALLGRNTVAFALGLYALIPHVVAPALYLTLLAWGAFFAVKKPAT